MKFKEVVIGPARLILGDCMDVLPTLPKVDAVVTDPPYGIDYGGRLKGKGDGFGNADKNGWKSYDAPDWDKARPERPIFDLLLQAAHVQVIWGGNYFTDFLPPSMHWLAWDKGQDGFSLADFELAWSSQNKAARRIHYPRALALKDGKEHPTQKPVAVMKWTLEQVPDADVILDPFMGSGTTGVACIQLGRQFIGVEREPRYFDIACRRIEQAHAQGRLFEPEQRKPEQHELLGAA